MAVARIGCFRSAKHGDRDNDALEHFRRAATGAARGLYVQSGRICKDMDDLIEKVRKYESLYNPKCREYRDHSIRNAAWESIAQELNQPVELCKDNWTKLRNSYSSALKRRRNKKSGQAATRVIPWKYEEQMNFLNPHMELRNTQISLTVPASGASGSSLDSNPQSPPYDFSSESTAFKPTAISSSGSLRSTLKRSFPAKSQPGLKEIYDLMKTSNDLKKLRYNSRQDMDETDLFFLSMSKAVKELPKLEQTKIKLDLHTAISQAEIRELTQSRGDINSNIPSNQPIPLQSGMNDSSRKQIQSPRPSQQYENIRHQSEYEPGIKE